MEASDHERRRIAADLHDGVAYARERVDETPLSGSMYGGSGRPPGDTDREQMAELMSAYMDSITDGPR